MCTSQNILYGCIKLPPPPGKKGREREGKEGDGKREGNERRRVREVKGRHGG